MEANQIITLVVALLSGLATCIPLVYKLVQFVQQASKEKNWSALLGLVIKLMQEAEVKFTDGATRKEWVMAMVQTSAEYINYPVDLNALSTMIDELCNMTKTINYTDPEKLMEQLEIKLPETAAQSAEVAQ